MIHFTMILEDLVLTSTLRTIDSEDGENDRQYAYDIHACDNLTGESGKATWTQDQWRAVMIILANDDNDRWGLDDQSMEQKRLYNIAKPAVAMLPDSCRPIP